jgi:predicted nucleic-acid-binding protein
MANLTKNTIYLDTNVILRFLVGDIPEMSIKAADVIANTLCTTPIEVIAEAVYNLEKYYNYTRELVSEKIIDFISLKEDLVIEGNIVRFACNLYASSNLDFVDCLLDGYAKVKGNPIFTFDADLKKQLGAKFFNG